MSFEVIPSPNFEKQLKRLVKKFPSLKIEIGILFDHLAENPKAGTPLGHDCFRIRLAIASKGKGKSGGARVITHLQVVQSNIILLSIYDKSDADSVSDSELLDLIAPFRTK